MDTRRTVRHTGPPYVVGARVSLSESRRGRYYLGRPNKIH